MKKPLVGYLATAFVMLALDILWLGVIAQSIYQQAIGHLMAEQPRLLVALVFYALYPLALLIFAIAPHAKSPALGKTVMMGALFGFFAYATYDLSNLATLKDWPLHMSLIDMGWGTAVSALSAGAGKLALNWAAKA